MHSSKGSKLQLQCSCPILQSVLRPLPTAMWHLTVLHHTYHGHHHCFPRALGVIIPSNQIHFTEFDFASAFIILHQMGMTDWQALWAHTAQHSIAQHSQKSPFEVFSLLITAGSNSPDHVLHLSNLIHIQGCSAKHLMCLPCLVTMNSHNKKPSLSAFHLSTDLSQSFLEESRKSTGSNAKGTLWSYLQCFSVKSAY